MDSLPRKRNRGAAVDRANLESTARLRNDGESSTSLASHLSFQQQRKRTKGLDLHPAAASVAPPPSRRGCFPTPPERGLKRKIGCILASTRTGRKRKIEKDYDFGLELGRGKFGLVRICKSKATGEELACKTLPKKTEENVYKEIEIMQHLSGHPNVVTLRAVYEDAESLHLVMELCTGGRLTDEMSRTGCYSEHQAANLIRELIMVIKYCHELGVVHRDIKPENVLRTSSGQLKLADFGLSTRFAKGQNLSGVVGTPSYVAPEVWAGTTYSEKVDVWGAGVLLHALLIGILPSMLPETGNGKRNEKRERDEKRNSEGEISVNAGRSVQRRIRNRVQRCYVRSETDCSEEAEEVISRGREILGRGHPWIKFYTESNVKIPPSIPYTESNVNIPPSIPKGKNCFLAVKDQCLEETPLPLSSYKREKRANSIPTEYGDGTLQGFSRLRQPGIDIQAAGTCEIVDALAAAISQMTLSEPKRSRPCVPAGPVPLQWSSHLKRRFCIAF
eukprot:PITA_17533